MIVKLIMSVFKCFRVLPAFDAIPILRFFAFTCCIALLAGISRAQIINSCWRDGYKYDDLSNIGDVVAYTMTPDGELYLGGDTSIMKYGAPCSSFGYPVGFGCANYWYDVIYTAKFLGHDEGGNLYRCGGCRFVDFSEPQQACIHRVDPGGVTDSTFAAAGYFFLEENNTFFNHVTVDESNGYLYVLGYHVIGISEHSPFILRLFADGTVDSSFGASGIYNFIDTDITFAKNSVLTSDGSILMGGTHQTLPTQVEAAIVKLTSSGELDVTFGDTGSVHSMPAAITYKGDGKIQLQSDERILQSYSGQVNQVYRGKLRRWSTNGTMDEDFIHDYDLGTLTIFTDFYVAANDAIFIGGKIGGQVTGGALIMKVLANGEQDTTFGDGVGYVKKAVSPVSQVFFLVEATTGEIIVAQEDMKFWKLSEDGMTPNCSAFPVPIGFPTTYTNVTKFSVVMSSSGFYVASGYAASADGSTYFALNRYDNDGIADAAIVYHAQLTYSGEPVIPLVDAILDPLDTGYLFHLYHNGDSNEQISFLRRVSTFVEYPEADSSFGTYSIQQYCEYVNVTHSYLITVTMYVQRLLRNLQVMLW